MNRFIEIRSINLKPGRREEILALMENCTDIVLVPQDVTVQRLRKKS